MRALMLETHPPRGDGPGAALAAALARRQVALDRVSKPLHFQAALDAAPTDGVLLAASADPQHDATGALLQGLRRSRPALSVLVLAAGAAWSARSAWLDLDADDCVQWPGDIDEIAARVAMAARRSVRVAQARELHHGPLVLNIDRRAVHWRGAPVDVSPHEFALLEALVRDRSRVLSRAALDAVLHGPGAPAAGNTVAVHVHALRRKLRPQLITTVRGVGYRLADAASLGA
jgi:DNA-binding response OmpR family regulator